jgi:hypothetical protein
MPFGNGATFAGHSVLRLLGRGELGEVTSPSIRGYRTGTP